MKLFYFGKPEGLTDEQQKDMENFIINCHYLIIATNNSETGARLSALGIIPGATANELCFATDVNSDKVKNILKNPVCELMLTDGNGQIVLSGISRIFTDMETKKKNWQDWMLGYFPNGVNDEKLCVIKFTTTAIRAMVE